MRVLIFFIFISFSFLVLAAAKIQSGRRNEPHKKESNVLVLHQPEYNRFKDSVATLLIESDPIRSSKNKHNGITIWKYEYADWMLEIVRYEATMFEDTRYFCFIVDRTGRQLCINSYYQEDGVSATTYMRLIWLTQRSKA